MTDMKHTEGPWSVAQPYSGFSEIKGPNGELIFGIAAGSREEKQTDEVCEANARLIAAAPDLLSVLEDAVANNSIVEGSRWWGDVYAAIAKARAQS